jgi:hypothetical protein
VSLGYTVDTDDAGSQAVAGTTALPGRRDAGLAVTGDTAALDLPLRDETDGVATDSEGSPSGETETASDTAGRTTASVVGIDEQLHLRYDRLGAPEAIDDSSVTYLAVSSDDVVPAIGQFRAPEPGRERTLELGFRPTLVEFTVVPTDGDTSTVTTTARPFAWSQGVAAITDDGVRQHALSPSVPSRGVERDEEVDHAEDTQHEHGEDPRHEHGEDPQHEHGEDPRHEHGEDPQHDHSGDTRLDDGEKTTRPGEGDSAANQPEAESRRTSEDQYVGVWLSTDLSRAGEPEQSGSPERAGDPERPAGREQPASEERTVDPERPAGDRRELRVVGVTDTGVRVTSGPADAAGETRDRPLVTFRAWPHTGDRQSESPTDDRQSESPTDDRQSESPTDRA